jgi:DNA sulfur modification protein DndE
VIGSETFGGARNITVRNCVFIGTDVGIRFKSGRGTGGPVGSIFVEGIRMRSIQNEAILFDMHYGEQSPGTGVLGTSEDRQSEPVTDLTPRFQDIVLRKVVCDGARRAIFVNGLPEMPVKNLLVEDSNISSTHGVLCIDLDGFQLRNTKLALHDGPVAELYDSKRVTLSGLSCPEGADELVRVDGEKTESIVIENVDTSMAKRGIELGRSVKSDAVIVRKKGR